MARYKIILSYDGTCFQGSQRQTASRTVQGELEKALKKLGWDMPTVHLAGRTDTGTHAWGQVAAFNLAWDHGVQTLGKALNAKLPQDMAVRKIEETEATFQPRRDAVSRWYRYRLFCAGTRDPLRERYAWRVWPKVSDLRFLSQIWLGVHDFGAFGAPYQKNGRTIRSVHSAEWKKHCDEWIFDIHANAFLYRMVRRMVFLQVVVGLGKINAEHLMMLFNHEKRIQEEDRHDLKTIPAGLAPACGLTLMEVSYNK